MTGAAPELHAGPVILRAHTQQDAERIVEQCQDPQTVRWTTLPSPYTRADADRYLRACPELWARGTTFSFAVEHEGLYVGTVDLRRDAGATWLGYVMHPAARGRGLAGAAIRGCLTWGFDQAGLEAVHWRAETGNWPSRRVAWAVGFRMEGTVRDLLPGRTGRRDAWVGSLRRGEPLRPTQIWHEPVELTDGVVRLRPHRADDIDACVRAGNDPAVHRWLPRIPHPYHRGDAEQHLEQIALDHAEGNSVCWAVADDQDRMVGEIGLFRLRAGLARTAEIGYWGHPAHRGRGYITRAARLAARHALVDRADGGLGLARVVLCAAQDNLASQAVARRAGFRLVGRERQEGLLADGTVWDELRFDLVPDDLPATGTG